MTTIRFIFLFLSIALYSCGQNTAKQKVDPKVTILSNKIIPLVNYMDNPDSCKQGILYLDSATAIDNNCFQCYYNKLMFLYSLKRFDKAVETINECIRIKPLAASLKRPHYLSQITLTLPHLPTLVVRRQTTFVKTKNEKVKITNEHCS